MACQMTKFNLLCLPAEIRQFIYSYLVLAPHESKALEDSDTSKKTLKGMWHITTSNSESANDEHYYTQRRVCHEAAKSLLLTSRLVYTEAAHLFWRHKTLVLSKPGQEMSMLHSFESSLYDVSRTARQHTRHIEFDLELTQEDLDNSCTDLQDRLSTINNLLRSHVQHLPQLQTIVWKLVQSSTSIDLGVETSDTGLLLATSHLGRTPWEYEPKVDQTMVDDLLKKADCFYSYAEGLPFGILTPQHWGCTKTLYKSNYGSEKEYTLNELVFRRGERVKTRNEVKMEDLKEEEGSKEEEESMDWEETLGADDEDIFGEGGIMEGFLEDYMKEEEE